MIFGDGRQGVEIRFDGFIEILRMDDQPSIPSRSGSHPTIESDRSGENEAVVVIGVFADEIDAARGTINRGGREKARAELFQKLKRVSQR